jgi:LEA14-like dessication related protein
MHYLKNIFIILIPLTLCSCGNFSEVIIGEISGVTIKGFEENALIVQLQLPVKNPTLHKITITDLDTKLFMNEQYLGKLNTKDPIVIRSKSSEVKEILLVVRFSNFLGAAINMMNIQKGQKVKFRLEGEIHARSMLISKTIPINESHEVVF